MLCCEISARIPHPALQATFPPGEGIIAAPRTTLGEGIGCGAVRLLLEEKLSAKLTDEVEILHR